MADQLEIKIVANSKKAVDALKKAGFEVESVSEKTSKSKAALQAFKSNWIAIAGTMATVVLAGKKIVSAYADQEEAQNTLAAAMKQAGTFTEEAFQKNLMFAQSLQKMTRLGDEAIIGVQKMLTNFGVEGEMMEKLTEQTLNLAAAKGMDLKTAADLVAKSVGSSTNALTRYGIEVTGAAGSTERMQAAVQNIEKLFGGAAVASAQTFAGSIDQMKNAIGDAAEKLGSVMAPAIAKIANMITVGANIFQKFGKVGSGALIAIVGALATATIAFKLFNTTLKTNIFIAIASAALTAVTLIIANWDTIRTWFIDFWDTLSTGFELAWGNMVLGLQIAVEFMAESFETMLNTGVSAINGIITAMNNLPKVNLKVMKKVELDFKKAIQGKIAARKLELKQMQVDAAQRKKDRAKEQLEKEKARELANKKQLEDAKKFDKEDGKQKDKKAKEDNDRKKWLAEQEKKMMRNSLELRKQLSADVTSDMIDAASEQKATLASVAAAGIRAAAGALSNEMKIRAIAAVATLNFPAAVIFGAAAASIKALGNRVASSVAGGKNLREGGIIDEPVTGIGQRTGTRFNFGEGGTPEVVTPLDEADPEGGGGFGGMQIFVEGDFIVQSNTLDETEDSIRDKLGVREFRR